MRICFCSLLLPHQEELLKKTKSKLPFARHKFGKSVIEGLESNNENDLTVMNIINTVNYPAFKQLIFRTENWSHRKESSDKHIGYINLFGIKYITQAYGLKKQIKKWIKQNKNEKLILYVQDMYLPSIFAVSSLARKYKNVKTCLMTGDLNGKYGLAPDSNMIKNFLIIKKDNYINKKIKKFDSFVLVTKYMAEAMSIQDKPYTIMECLYSVEENKLHKIDNSQTKEKIIFNAGSQREEYGALHLLRAFSLIQDENYQLWLAGGGTAEPRIKEFAAKNPRIKFFGFISPKQVEEYQKQATVLINPRTSEHEFVKYSFASKNMECLASGKPYIAHKLPCNPPEYDEHIQYPDDETDEALKNKIIEICEMSAEKRNELSRLSRQFIVEEKNPVKQCKKILEMLENL